MEEINIETIKNSPRTLVARKLARALIKQVGFKSPPVSLWKIIVHLKLESKFDVQPVEDFGENISGVIVVIDDSTIIGFNKKQHWHRRRFTIAHEIGHFKMGSMHNDLMAALTSNNPAEIEANQFAAELLIPYQFLKTDFQNSTKSIDELSMKYRVSKEAMGWRISKSGLLGKF